MKKPGLALLAGCLLFAMPGRSEKPGSCECLREGIAGALKAIEGAQTVKGLRLTRNGAIVNRLSGDTVFRLEGANPNATLLAISPPGFERPRRIFTGWEDQRVYRVQVFAADKRNRPARLILDGAVEDRVRSVRFFRPPDARSEPIVLIDVLGGAAWSATYLLRPGGLDQLFESTVYDVLDLDRDGVYEIVSWQRRPNDIRCHFGFMGFRVYPEIYGRSGSGYERIWPGPEWSPYGGSVESAVNAVRRGEGRDEKLPWGSPLQIAGTVADVDGDGALELVALTDTLAAEPGPQYLAVYKLERGAMRLATRTLFPSPWTAMVFGSGTDPAGSRFVVDMADPPACRGGGTPDGPGVLHAVYGFRAGRFERQP